MCELAFPTTRTGVLLVLNLNSPLVKIPREKFLGFSTKLRTWFAGSSIARMSGWGAAAHTRKLAEELA